LSALPLQGDQASTCGGGEQEGALRDEVRRDNRVLVRIVLGGREAVQGRVGQTTFLTGGRRINLRQRARWSERRLEGSPGVDGQDNTI